MICIALAFAPGAQATDTGGLLEPFAIRNLNPFLGLYGIPAQQSTAVVGGGLSSVNLQLDVVSHFTDAETDQEFIAIDGETYRLSLRYARGFGDRWEAGAEVPLVAHSGGFLDGVINEWHGFWGLPTLGRDRVEDDQLRYEYVRAGETLVDVDASGTGIGDVLLFAGKTLAAGATTVTLRGQIKLPTGDPENLRGSGAADAAISAAGSRAVGGRVSITGRIGAAYLGRGDVLPELQRRWSVFGSAFVGWQTFKSVSLKAQLDVQSPLYEDSAFNQLTDTAIQLTFGGSVRLGKKSFLDLSFTEDEFNPDVTSDFAFQIRLRAVH